MERTYKKIQGTAPERETQYDLNKEEDIDNLIEKLELENKDEEKPSSAKAPSEKPASKRAVKKNVPAWAKTQNQIKKEKDQEIDDLIEFAYELDYETFVEDMEVRQALALIKDRVEEMKQERIADAAPPEQAIEHQAGIEETRSVKSNVSQAS